MSSRICARDLLCDRSRLLTGGRGTIESAVSRFAIRRQYSSQIVTHTLSVKLDQQRAYQAKLVNQLRLIHHHSPPHTASVSPIPVNTPSSVSLSVSRFHTHARTHTPAPSLPEALLGWINPNETQILFVYVTTTQESSIRPDPQTFPFC